MRDFIGIGHNIQIEELGRGLTVHNNGKYMHFPGVTINEMDKGFKAWETNLIKDAFPFLNSDQREFILSGITPAQWENIFPEDNDPED